MATSRVTVISAFVCATLFFPQGHAFLQILGQFMGGGSRNSAAGQFAPVSFQLPTPPVLRGPSAANDELVKAEQVHKGLLTGPGTFVNYEGQLFVGTLGGKIINVAKCKPEIIADLKPAGCRDAKSCGMLLTLRRDPETDDLIALDTYRGLFRITNGTWEVKQIYNATDPISGRVPVHLNDFVVTDQGLIFMTDSSDTYDISKDIYIGMEGRKSGRLIFFMPSTGQIRELLPNQFVFPNGIELTSDGKALLVSETGRARIQRISLERPTWLRMTTFASNLPGLPDNIRASDHNTYWLGMAFARHSGVSNPMDRFSGIPMIRSMGARTWQYSTLRNMFSRWGMAVELNAYGHIIKSLHDPKGTRMDMVSEVNDFGGVLNLGSPRINYMARILVPSRGLKLDSFMEVIRSRCLIPEEKVEETRAMIKARYFNNTAS